MNRSALVTLLLAIFFSKVAGQTATLDLSLGILSNNGGVPVTDGSLLLVIGSTNNTFTAPTPTSFSGGAANQVILWSGAFDSATSGTPGAMTFSFQTPIPNNGVTTGNGFVVLWFPTLTTGSTVPGAGTQYGVYGYSTGVTSWTVPASGALVSYSLLTTSADGALPDSAGRALQTVSAIPEPTTYATCIGLVGLAVGIWRRFRGAA